MARSTQMVILSTAFLLFWMCKPAYAQPLGVIDLAPFGGGLGSVVANIPGAAMLDSIGTGDTIASVLSTIGVNQGIIDAIITPISSSREAANTVRDMIASNAANRLDVMGQIASPGQAVSAFNDLMNSAFREAAGELAGMMFSRRPKNGTDGADSEDSPFRSVSVGFGLPVDRSIFGEGFKSGAHLPPVTAATPADFDRFKQQFYGDVLKQQNAVAKFQKEAAKKERTGNAVKRACVQYALGEFLDTFANLLLQAGQSASTIFSILGQFAGLNYSGLTQQGEDYLNAYCCALVHREGINFDMGIVDGALTFGPLSVELDQLAGIPGDIAAAAGAPTNVAATIDAVTSTVVSALGKMGNGAAGNVAGDLAGGVVGDVAGGVVGDVTGNAAGIAAASVGGNLANNVAASVANLLGTSTQQQQCNVVEWMTFALQNDKRLKETFGELIKATLRLEAAVYGSTAQAARRAGETSSMIVKRVANTNGGQSAALSDVKLGNLLSAVKGKK